MIDAIPAAAERAVVLLADGREGRLLKWSERDGHAKVVVGGRHYRVRKADVIGRVSEAGARSVGRASSPRAGGPLSVGKVAAPALSTVERLPSPASPMRAAAESQSGGRLHG